MSKSDRLIAELVHRLPDSFWKRVKIEDGCWLWIGAYGNHGYGTFKWRGFPLLAHRIMHWYRNGAPTPPATWVLHRCHNPRCVNPEHLRWGTEQDNSTDMLDAGRSSHGERHQEACRRRFI